MSFFADHRDRSLVSNCHERQEWNEAMNWLFLMINSSYFLDTDTFAPCFFFFFLIPVTKSICSRIIGIVPSFWSESLSGVPHPDYSGKREPPPPSDTKYCLICSPPFLSLSMFCLIPKRKNSKRELRIKEERKKKEVRIKRGRAKKKRGDDKKKRGAKRGKKADLMRYRRWFYRRWFYRRSQSSTFFSSSLFFLSFSFPSFLFSPIHFHFLFPSNFLPLLLPSFPRSFPSITLWSGHSGLRVSGPLLLPPSFLSQLYYWLYIWTRRMGKEVEKKGRKKEKDQNF